MHLDLEAARWQVINDTVMGGLSRAQVDACGATMIFRGYLSLENNGGFASVRRSFNQNFTGITGFRLKLRGDGRCYQFRLRTDEYSDGVAWRAEFETDGQLQTIQLGLGDFEPVIRGRKVAHSGVLDPAQVRLLGFMLADRRTGPFELQVLSIETLGGSRP